MAARFDLDAAVALATRAHAGQVDKRGADYIGHPSRVMAHVDGATTPRAAVTIAT